MDAKRELLRHTLATLAYRAGKAMRNAPPSFATFAPADSSRTPAQLVAHMGDLFDWALSIAKGAQAWHDSTPLAWEAEVARFFESLGRFDAYLASDASLGATPSSYSRPDCRCAHPPTADHAAPHSGATMRSENYFRADIVTGRVGGADAAASRILKRHPDRFVIPVENRTHRQG
jgi:hypothetical protein